MRWTLFAHHEMYIAGHLIQAAIADKRVRGKDQLLGVACRFADHICDQFGPDARPEVDTHPEIEMALVELFRLTGNKRYLEQARYFVDQRGKHEIDTLRESHFDQEYHQNHTPFREMTRMEGHAVRMLYLNCGASDVAAETNDMTLKATLDRLWENTTDAHLYVTGGLGARYETEGFGRDFDLPNNRAYAESCAAVASIMWNWRMLLLDPNSRYADLMELTLYNGMLSGLSQGGDEFFYVNPLADTGDHRRQSWFECACCPSNLSRTIAMIGGYFYTTSAREILVHLYDSNEATLTLGSGETVRLAVETNYPWSGKIDVTIQQDGSFALGLRIPAWAGMGWCAEINGETTKTKSLRDGYLILDRDWHAGDVVTLDLEMPTRVLQSHPKVYANQGLVAIARGPLIYCFEAEDNRGTDTRLMVVEDLGEFQPRVREDLMDGLTFIEGAARFSEIGNAWDGKLYRRCSEDEPLALGPLETVIAIPYFAWANRSAGSMDIWVRGSSTWRK